MAGLLGKLAPTLLKSPAAKGLAAGAGLAFAPELFDLGATIIEGLGGSRPKKAPEKLIADDEESYTKEEEYNFIPAVVAGSEEFAAGNVVGGFEEILGLSGKKRARKRAEQVYTDKQKDKAEISAERQRLIDLKQAQLEAEKDINKRSSDVQEKLGLGALDLSKTQAEREFELGSKTIDLTREQSQRAAELESKKLDFSFQDRQQEREYSKILADKELEQRKLDREYEREIEQKKLATEQARLARLDDERRERERQVALVNTQQAAIRTAEYATQRRRELEQENKRQQAKLIKKIPEKLVPIRQDQPRRIMAPASLINTIDVIETSAGSNFPVVNIPRPRPVAGVVKY